MDILSHKTEEQEFVIFIEANIPQATGWSYRKGAWEVDVVLNKGFNVRKLPKAYKNQPIYYFIKGVNNA